MKTKKIWWTLLLTCIVAIIFLVLFIQQKQRVIASQEQEILQLEYKTHLIEWLEQRANNIIQEREQNKMDCEILWEDVPYDLLWLCGEPK
jgi:cell division protein FtsL